MYHCSMRFLRFMLLSGNRGVTHLTWELRLLWEADPVADPVKEQKVSVGPESAAGSLDGVGPD
jgi:hypothetical protein